MSTAGWTPVDETVKGWTPVAEAATPQPVTKPIDPNMPTMSAYQPSTWDRIRQAFPIIDRLQTGLRGPGEQSGSMSTAQAVAKPLPGMSEERAIAPEQAMTGAERQAHPVATGAGEFLGGMTTPQNILTMMMMGGKIPTPISRTFSGLFAAQMLHGAASEVPDFQKAMQNKDTSEMERIATHIGLGALFGYTTGKRAYKGEVAGAPVEVEGRSVYEGFRNTGRAIADYTRRAKSLEDINQAAALLHGKVRESLQTLQARLKQDGVAAIQPLVEADQASGTKAILPSAAVAEVTKAKEQTGYHPAPAEEKLLDKLSAGGQWDSVAQSLGYPTEAAAAAKMGPVWESLKQNPQYQAVGASAGLSLDEAIKLRSALGTAASRTDRAGNAKGSKVLWTAYEELGNAVARRMNELQGAKNLDAPNRSFNDYNANFKSSFELDKGFTGDLMDSIMDRHEATPKLKKFSEADLTDVARQFKLKGMDPRDFYGMQRDAKSISAAHDAVMGKMAKGLYRQVMQDTPAEALVPMGVYMLTKGAGLYGFAPYMLATMAGKFGSERTSMVEAGKILRRLNIPENKKYLQLRTEPPPTGASSRTGSESD